MRVIRDVKYGSLDEQVMNLYLPECDGFKTLICFHGGGLEAGCRSDGEAMFEELTALGIAVASPDYRMYPTAVFPEYIEDAALAVKHVLENIKGYGGNGSVYVSGNSAGAYLTMMLCLNDKLLNDAGVDRSLISGYLSDSAQQLVHYNVLRERGEDARIKRIDAAAPIYYVNAKTNFPKLHLIYYSNDIPARKEENLLMFATLKSVSPSLNVTIKELEGVHCSGQSTKGQDGQLLLVKEIVEFMAEK